MDTTKIILTDRLRVQRLSVADDAFIFHLLNTAGWIRFIGQRNIYTRQDAVDYILKVNANPHLDYRVVNLKATHEPIGLVTWIQREYLDHPDIGFAFLPEFGGYGYATESATALLKEVQPDGSIFHAVVLPSNLPSIRVAKKLGLHFDKEIQPVDETLHLYTKSFFNRDNPDRV